MQDTDRKQFVALINALAGSFRVDPTEALLDGYWFGLEDLSVAAVKTAVGKAIRTGDRMPNPAELRKLAGVMTPEMRAITAWNAVRLAIRQHGAYASVNFDDPAINATIRTLGGWPALCAKDSDELDKWTVKEFGKTYAAFVGHGVGAEVGKALAGVHEHTNFGRGYAVEPPKQIATGLEPARLLLGDAPNEAVKGLITGLANGKELTR